MPQNLQSFFAWLLQALLQSSDSSPMAMIFGVMNSEQLLMKMKKWRFSETKKLALIFEQMQPVQFFDEELCFVLDCLLL